MATQTMQLASAENDGVWVQADYNDQNNQATLARWSNTLDKPCLVRVILPSGKVAFDGTLPPAGQPGSSGEMVLSGADRFNVTTQTPTVNLAPWSTSTSP